jgi:cellobiose phosphorylase
MACPSPSKKSGDGVLALRKHVTLSAGESITLVFAFGYIPTLEQSLFSREIMLSKYKAAAAVPEQLLVKHAAAWQAAVISLNLTSQHPDAKSATREVTWHSIQHRQMLTKDNFFGEYILSQGTAYQWAGGSQAAARDPLQHLLPLILTDGKKAKSILRYTMKELAPPWAVNATQPNNLPYGLFGHGIMQTAVNRHDGSISQSSDEELYMFYAVTEYLLASRDWAFLNETVVALQHGHGTARTVVECLVDSFSHIKRTGFGPHGLMKLLTGDWNDAMGGYALKSGATVAELMSRGESTCNAAMAAAIIPRLADALGLAQNSGLQIPGGNNTLRSMRQFAKQQAQALRRAWNGEWLSRAWMPVNSSYNPDGWFCTNGEDYRLCLEPQPWAIMATKMGESVLSSAERSTLVQSMENLLHLGAPGTWDVSSAQRGITGAAVASKCWHNGSSGFPCGYHENAGAWYSQNHPLVMALAQENASLAWKEWVANSLFHSARLWPTYWPGIWSAADAYGSSLASFKSGAVGISYFPDMPVFCTHAHAWPLYSMARMAGLTFDHGGLRVNPAVPLEMGDYAFLTPLASVTRQRIVNIGSNGSVTYAYSGEWRPASFVDECVISVDINALHGNSSRVTVEVVGGEQNASIATGCGPAQPLRWRATVDAVGEGRKV